MERIRYLDIKENVNMTHTPAMQQYYDMKKQYSDAILFFRMGDFYEMFDDDAIIANQVLSIALTTRNKNAEKPTPLAGIPYHAKDKYLGQLIEAGYRVAIAEQIGDASGKGIVEREVVRVVTPSTLTLESDNYNAPSSPNLLVLFSQDERLGIANFDLSKFHVETTELAQVAELINLIYTYAPEEVVISGPDTADIEDLTKILAKNTKLHIYTHKVPSNAIELVSNHFGENMYQNNNLETYEYALKSIATGLDYLQQNQKQKIDFFQTISWIENKQFLALDSATIRSLDIVFNSVIGKSNQGTLLSIIDKTYSSLGKRKIYHEILHPLQNIDTIKQRQNCIKELVSDVVVFDKIQKELKNVYDIDAILGRIGVNRASIKDINNLKNTLIALENIKNILGDTKLTHLQNIISF